MKAGFPFLAFTVAEVLHELGGGIAKPSRDWFVHGVASEVESGVPGVGGITVFLGEGESDGSVGENESRFGHADAFDGLKAGGGETQGAISGEADVLRSEDDHAASDELRVFAGDNHASEVVEGSVDVRTAHGFDEGGNVVVVVVAFFVIAGELFAGGLDNNVLGDFLIQRCGEFQITES